MNLRSHIIGWFTGISRIETKRNLSTFVIPITIAMSIIIDWKLKLWFGLCNLVIMICVTLFAITIFRREIFIRFFNIKINLFDLIISKSWFSIDFWGSNLFYLQLTKGLIVKTLTDSNIDSLTFCSDQLIVIYFQYTSNIFSPFISDQIECDLKELLLNTLSYNNRFIKYKFIDIVWCHLWCQCVWIMFQLHFTWKLYLHLYRKNT